MSLKVYDPRLSVPGVQDSDIFQQERASGTASAVSAAEGEDLVAFWLADCSGLGSISGLRFLGVVGSTTVEDKRQIENWGLEVDDLSWGSPFSKPKLLHVCKTQRVGWLKMKLVRLSGLTF